MATIIIKGNLPILDNTRLWECPSCGKQHKTKDQRIITPMHPCVKLKGIMAPYVEVPRGKQHLDKHTHVHRVIEREDYVGKEKGVMHDENGKAVMAVHTERESGHDTTVFAAVATLRME